MVDTILPKRRKAEQTYPYPNKNLTRPLGPVVWEEENGKVLGYVGNRMLFCWITRRGQYFALGSSWFSTKYQQQCGSLRGAKNTAQWALKLFFTQITAGGDR